MVRERIQGTLDAAQSSDQAGFRKGFSVEDHLFTLTALTELTEEHNVPLWICTVDFHKAFDTVNQNKFWEALQEQGVPAAYIRLLCKLYFHQTGRIETDKVSKSFEINRGTKQGTRSAHCY